MEHGCLMFAVLLNRFFCVLVIHYFQHWYFGLHENLFLPCVTYVCYIQTEDGHITSFSPVGMTHSADIARFARMENQKFRSNHCHKSSLPLVSQIFFDLADTAFFFFPLLLLLLLLWRQVLFSSSLERKVFCTGSDSSAVSSQPRNAQCWKLHLLPSSLNHGKLELTRTEAHWVSQLAHSNHREHSNLTPPLLSVQALHTLTCSPEAFISIP